MPATPGNTELSVLSYFMASSPAQSSPVGTHMAGSPAQDAPTSPDVAGPSVLDTPINPDDQEEERVIQPGKRHKKKREGSPEAEKEARLPTTPDTVRVERRRAATAAETSGIQHTGSPSRPGSDDISMITDGEGLPVNSLGEDPDDWPDPIENVQNVYMRDYHSPFPGVPCVTVAAYMRNRKAQLMYINRAGPRRKGWYFLSETSAPVEGQSSVTDVRELVQSRPPKIQLISDQTTRKLDAPVSQLEEKVTKKSINALLAVVVVSSYDNENSLIESLDPTVVKRAREYETISKRTRKTRSLPKGSNFFQRYPTTYVLIRFSDGQIRWETSSAYRSIYGKDAIKAEFNIFNRLRQSWADFIGYYQEGYPAQYESILPALKQEPDIRATGDVLGDRRRDLAPQAPLSNTELAALIIKQMESNPEVLQTIEKQFQSTRNRSAEGSSDIKQL